MTRSGEDRLLWDAIHDLRKSVEALQASADLLRPPVAFNDAALSAESERASAPMIPNSRG